MVLYIEVHDLLYSLQFFCRKNVDVVDFISIAENTIRWPDVSTTLRSAQHDKHRVSPYGIPYGGVPCQRHFCRKSGILVD